MSEISTGFAVNVWGRAAAHRPIDDYFPPAFGHAFYFLLMNIKYVEHLKIFNTQACFVMTKLRFTCFLSLTVCFVFSPAIISF